MGSDKVRRWRRPVLCSKIISVLEIATGAVPVKLDRSDLIPFAAWFERNQWSIRAQVIDYADL